MTEFKCVFSKEKDCDDCNDCILCYKCVFCKERFDETLKVLCEHKGKVDLHGVCDLYMKKDLIK